MWPKLLTMIYRRRTPLETSRKHCEPSCPNIEAHRIFLLFSLLSLSLSFFVSEKWTGRESRILTRGDSSRDDAERSESPAPLGRVALRAVIVEPRWSSSLDSVLANFLAVLGPATPILWWNELPVSLEAAGASPSVLRAHAAGQLVQRQLGLSMTKGLYNRLRMNVTFYNSLNAAHALMFEKDTVLCSASPRKIHDFLSFDYIGAPWPHDVRWCKGSAAIPGSSCCCNSGLSLVNVDQMVKLIKEVSKLSNHSKRVDLFFPVVFPHLQKNLSMNFRLADPQNAQAFAAESYWEGIDAPFGLHKPWWAYKMYKGGSMDFWKLLEKCPEVGRLCSFANATRSHPSKLYGWTAQQFDACVCREDSGNKSLAHLCTDPAIQARSTSNATIGHPQRYLCKPWCSKDTCLKGRCRDCSFCKR